MVGDPVTRVSGGHGSSLALNRLGCLCDLDSSRFHAATGSASMSGVQSTDYGPVTRCAYGCGFCMVRERPPTRSLCGPMGGQE